MLKNVTIEGPLVKGYNDKKPLVKGQDISNVVMQQGLSVVNNTLFFRYIDDDGNTQTKSILLKNPDLSVKLGLTAGTTDVLDYQQMDDLNRIKTNAISAYEVTTPSYVVNSFFSKALIRFDTPTDAVIRDGTGVIINGRYQHPWIAFPKSETEGLVLEIFDEGELDTDFWVDAYTAEEQMTKDIRIMVSKLPFNSETKSRYLTYFFQTFKFDQRG